MSMFDVKFWKDAVERVVASFAGTYVSSAAVFGGIFDYKALEIAAGAAVFSLFKSLAASQIGNKDSASLTV